MHIYLKNKPVKFHPDLILIAEPWAFLKSVASTRTKSKNNGMCSNVGSFPDAKIKLAPSYRPQCALMMCMVFLVQFALCNK